jgi:predicted nucleotidyltransferase component of viral defense system
MTANRAASIHARLLTVARKSGEDFNRVLHRYALERWLFRLSESDLRDQFWLKGALLLQLWFDDPVRPTRDADFLGLRPAGVDSLRKAVQAICRLPADDGMRFDPETVTVEEIREEAQYGGLRAKFLGYLGNARCTMQLDVGHGDAVTPGAENIEYPTLLADLPNPRLKAYPRETAFAEKLEAIATHGMKNSRMKDYFDLHMLAREDAMDLNVLARAIAATFSRRQTPLADPLPTGLMPEFAKDPLKCLQWETFLKKNGLEAASLEAVVSDIGAFCEKPLRLAREGPPPT